MINIRDIEFELTNRCNAACPLCARTGKVFQSFDDIPVNILEDIFRSDSVNLDYVKYCGTFGDPLSHPNFLEIVEIASYEGVKTQDISTNGSIRNEDWWKQLAQFPVKTIFCIDGLEDTNHIYRRNTSFKKIIKNAKSFIDNGGNAEWRFIPFEHNEHQVEEARQMAEDLGFDNFVVKVSVRTTEKEGIRYSKKFTNDFKKSYTFTRGIKNIEEKEIECYSKRRGHFFITAQAQVYPCCFIAITRDNRGIKNDLHKYSIEEIIDDYRKNLRGFELDWEKRSIIKCNNNCGTVKKTHNFIVDNF